MKNLFLQQIRAICIIAVILIHLKPGSFDSFSFDYWLIFRRLINFPVAIFFFLSGYFVNIKMLNDSPINYYKQKFKRLLIPYIAWGIIYTIYNIVIGRQTVDYLIILKIIIGLPAAHLYYINVLLQFCILTPIILYILNSKHRLLIIFLYFITPIFLVFLYVYIYKNQKMLPFYNFYFPAWILFYILGLAFKNGHIKIKLNFRLNVILIFFTLLLSLVEICILRYFEFPISFLSSQITISNFLYCIFIIAFFVDNPSNKINNILLKIGDFSFGIYFIHLLYIIAFNFIFDKLVTISNIWLYIIYQFFTMFLTLICSFISVFLLKKVLGKKMSYYLGLV